VTRFTPSSTKQTLVAACNGLGENLAFRVIYKAINMNAGWAPEGSTALMNGDGKVRAYRQNRVQDEKNFDMQCNGKPIHVTYSCNYKGGMTPEEFIHWLKDDIFPFCHDADPDDIRTHYVVDIDGDDSHSLALDPMLECKRNGVQLNLGLPNSSADTQVHDDGEGPFHTFKSASWRSSLAGRKLALGRFGLAKRPIDRTDIPEMFNKAVGPAFSHAANQRALDNVGLVPFSRAPLYRDHIMKTKDQPLAEACKLHLDGERIKFFVDAGKLEEASVELMTMLGGNKFSSGKMWKYAGTSDCGIAIRRAYAKHKELKEATAAAARLDKSQAKQQREADMQGVIAQWQATNNGKAHCDCYLGQHQDHTCVGGHLCRNCHAIVKSRSCKKAPCVLANRDVEAEHIAKVTEDAEGERAGSEE
jgi:hypothetical protein